MVHIDFTSVRANASNGNRKLWLSILRGLTILLVVMNHVQLVDMSTGANHPFCSDVAYLFAPVRMPAFIFVSGGLLYLSRISKEWKVSDLYIDKFHRIMYPFIFFVIVFYVVKMLMNGFLKHPISVSWTEFFSSFVFYVGYPSAPLWFLATLMTLMLLYPFFVWLCRRRALAVSFLLFSAVFYFVDFSRWEQYNYFNILHLNQYLIYFYAGIFAFRFNLLERLSSPWAVPVAVAFYAALYYYDVALLLSLSGILMLVSICMNLERYVPMLFGSFREYIFQIYLMSMFFQGFVELVLWRKMFYNETFFLVFYVLNITFGLYLPILVSMVVKRFGNRFVKLCFGLKP